MELFVLLDSLVFCAFTAEEIKFKNSNITFEMLLQPDISEVCKAGVRQLDIFLCCKVLCDDELG